MSRRPSLESLGRIKVSTQLFNFLKTDHTASKWFQAPAQR